MSNGALQLRGFKNQLGLFNNRNKISRREIDGAHWTDNSNALIKPSSFSRSWAKLQSLDEIKPRAFPFFHPPKLFHSSLQAPSRRQDYTQHLVLPIYGPVQQTQPNKREKSSRDSLNWEQQRSSSTCNTWSTPEVVAVIFVEAWEAFTGPLPHFARHRCLNVARRTMSEK